MTESIEYSILVPIEHQKQINDMSDLVESLSKDYIWHKEPFNPFQGEFKSDPLVLQGQLCYGDCVEDEWFVVYMLLKISVEYKELLMSIRDSDGEFLLIEAAEHLDTWMTPEATDRRVFVYGGKIHIIPAAVSIRNMEDALEFIQSHGSETIASIKIQDCIQRRIEACPSAYIAQKHTARMLIPKKVAHLLLNDRNLVSYAVDSFYTRDPLSMRFCQSMTVFEPSSSVEANVVMTKTLYAQLQCQPFVPPAVFCLPPVDSPKHRQAALGAKLACGFEMLFHKCLQDSHRLASLDADSHDFQSDIQWKSYLDSLQRSRYFHDELEGSALYSKLEAVAKRHHIQDLAAKAQQSHTMFQKMQNILNLSISSFDATELGPEDSDEWLNVDPATLDNELAAKCELMNKLDSTDTDTTADNLTALQSMHNVIKGFQSFMERESGLEGIETLHDSDTDADSDDSSDDEDLKPVTLDSTRFLETMMKILSISEDGTLQTQEGNVGLDEDESSSEDGSVDDYMDAMDRELYRTKVGQGFERRVNDGSSDDDMSSEDEVDVYQHIDLDANLLKNALTSFESQQGESGPMSNILTSLGIGLNSLSKEE